MEVNHGIRKPDLLFSAAHNLNNDRERRPGPPKQAH